MSPRHPKSRRKPRTDTRASNRAEIDDELFEEPRDWFWREGCGISLQDLLAKPQRNKTNFERRLAEEPALKSWPRWARKQALKEDRLCVALNRADELVRTRDDHGREGALAALDAFVTFAGTHSEAISILRTALVDLMIPNLPCPFFDDRPMMPDGRHPPSSLEQRFIGRVAGLVEVLSWPEVIGKASKVYKREDSLAKTILELADEYARLARFKCAEERPGYHRGEKSVKAKISGTISAKSIHTSVKSFCWDSVLANPAAHFNGIQVSLKEMGAEVVQRSDHSGIEGPYVVQRMCFLDVVRTAAIFKDIGEDLRLWSLDQARHYFDTSRLR